MAQEPKTAAEGSTEGLDAGSYEVVRQRLVGHVTELTTRAEKLNEARKAIFGSSAFELVQTSRVRTENAAHARDMVSVGGNLLFAFNVTLGLKSVPSVGDVFALYQLDAAGGDGLEPLSLEGTFLSTPAFVNDFTTTFKYARNPRILKLRRTDKRLLIVVQIGDKLSDVTVFRFGIDGKGKVSYIDARGEEDNVDPPSFAFKWTRTGRDQQVTGPHPHVNVLDTVFVECVGGDLTVKIENNTKDGRGIFREPVADANQTLDDAEISYAEAVASWYDNVYLPAVEAVRVSGLMADFPGRTDADLYLWTMLHLADLQDQYSDAVDPSMAASDLARQQASGPVDRVVRAVKGFVAGDGDVPPIVEDLLGKYEARENDAGEG